MTTQQVAFGLGWECSIDDLGPHWVTPGGHRCDSTPEYWDGQRMDHISAWAFQRGYNLVCGILVNGFLAWMEDESGEEVETAYFGDTIGEAVCASFLDLHSRLAQNKNTNAD